MQNKYCVLGRDRCFIGDALMLKEVKEQYGYNIAIAWLEAQLSDLNNQVGTKWKMDVQQLNDCANLILERHSTLKVTELMFFFRGLKSGDYGDFYGTVDITGVMRSLRQFYDVRANELARLDREQKEREKEEKRQRDRLEAIKSSRSSSEVYKDFLYECCQTGGAERVREYLIEHGVKVNVATKDERYPTIEECDPMTLIKMAEERERIMSGISNKFR